MILHAYGEPVNCNECHTPAAALWSEFSDSAYAGVCPECLAKQGQTAPDKPLIPADWVQSAVDAHIAAQTPVVTDAVETDKDGAG